MSFECPFTITNYPQRPAHVVAFVESPFGETFGPAIPRHDGITISTTSSETHYTIGCGPGINRVHSEFWYLDCEKPTPLGPAPDWCDFGGVRGLASNVVDVEGIPIPEPDPVLGLGVALVVLALLRRWGR